MLLGPVFHVEMLGLGRRRRYYLTRVVYGLFLLLLMGICYSATFTSWRPATLQMQAEFAREFFVTFSWMQLVVVLALTPAMLAGTIAGEHERRTIDYLLTTSLGDAEITLGKFVARLAAVGGQLAAGLPILAITMSLGGIAPEQLFQSFAVALVTLASLGAISLAVSTRCRTSRDAITRCYLILFAVLIVPGALWGIAESLHYGTTPGSVWAVVGERTAPVLRTATELNPVVFLGIVMLEPPLGHISPTTFAAVHLGAAVAFLGTSIVGLRRFYVRQANKGTPTKKAKRRWGAPRLGERPMWWKERVAGRGGVKLGWFGRLAAAALYLLAVYGIGWAFYESVDERVGESPTPIEIFGMGGVPAIACLGLLLATARTAGSVTSEREQDTWITLLGTPLEAREIVWAKFAAALYSLRYWYLLVVLTWGLCIAVRPGFVWAIPVLVIVHGVVLCAAAALGLLCSLMSKTSLRAMGAALAVLICAAWIGPMFFAVITRTKEFTAFSAPIMLGTVQAAAVEYLTARSRSSDWVDKMSAVTFLAALGYAGLAAIMYAIAVGLFDELAGRVVPRVATSEPESTEQPTGEPTAEVEAAVEPEAET